MTGWQGGTAGFRRPESEEHQVLGPRPGERVDVDNPPEVDGWWQSIA